MVIDALLRQVAIRIRSALSVDESRCRVMPDRFPIPSMGTWFISVYGGKFKKVHEESYCIHGPFTFHLQMTMRPSAVPFDRQGTDITAKATTGMIAIFENAITAIETNTANILADANTTIGYAGIISGPLLMDADFEAQAERGGGEGDNSYLNADNERRTAFSMKASFKTYINRSRS